MKVFISSVITGYEAYRAAVQTAVETLGHEVIRAEDFGASSSSPRVACLSGVRQADLVVLLLGPRYGAVQPSGLSATHEEFQETRDRKEIVAFVEDVADREPKQGEFVSEVQAWQGGVFTQAFSDAESLRRAVTRALHNRLLEDARGAADPAEIRQRALSLLPSEERARLRSHATLGLSVAGGPKQVLLRPIEIESDELDRGIFQLALNGPHAVFDRREGTDKEIVTNALLLKQPSRSVTIRTDGSLVLHLSMKSESRMGAVIEEDVRDLIARGLGFCNDVISLIDSTERIRHVSVSALIIGADHAGWRTRAEDEKNPTSMTMSMGQREPVTADVRPRAALRTQRLEIAEDLTVLMRLSSRVR